MKKQNKQAIKKAKCIEAATFYGASSWLEKSK